MGEWMDRALAASTECEDEMQDVTRLDAHLRCGLLVLPTDIYAHLRIERGKIAEREKKQEVSNDEE